MLLLSLDHRLLGLRENKTIWISSFILQLRTPDNVERVASRGGVVVVEWHFASWITEILWSPILEL